LYAENVVQLRTNEETFGRTFKIETYFECKRRVGEEIAPNLEAIKTYLSWVTLTFDPLNGHVGISAFKLKPDFLEKSNKALVLLLNSPK